MRSFIEPLILFWVLFLRVSAGTATPGEPAEFSAIAEATRMLLYTVPSLLLVWYLMFKEESPKEWGITFPQKKDLATVALCFPALLLIGLTISQVSVYFREGPAIPPLPPTTAVSWAILALSCIASAYLEESYFRSYLLSKRKELGLSPHQAVLFATLLFSICHTYEGPWGFLNAALSGVLLAFVFLRFQSLHGIAIAHALYNICAYVLEALPTT